MPNRLIPSFVVAFATMAAACTANNKAPPDQDFDEFCADYAKAVCQVGTGACDFDLNSCETFQMGPMGICMTKYGGGQSSTQMYSQPNGRSCINALNNAYSGNVSSISAATLAMIDMTCSKVFVGTQPVNAECTTDGDCSGTLICVPEVGMNKSVCVSMTTSKNPGDVCADPGDQCTDNSYCAVPSGGGLPVCVVSPSRGAECSDSMPCGSSDQCVGGICKARGGPGDTCATNADCSSSAPYCDTYAPAGCASGLSFGRGSIDCKGIAGLDQGTAGASTSADASAGD